MRAQLEAGSERMDGIEQKLDGIKTDTAEMLEFFNSVRGAFRVLDMLGKLAKPLSYIMMFVGGCVGVWLALKNGGKVHE